MTQPASFVAAATPVTPGSRPATPQPTPQQRMARRFPQPVRVGFLIGLPVLDEDSSIVGRIRQVVLKPDGGHGLIVAYGGVLGFGRHPIAIPVELVGMLGAQVAAIDMLRAEMDRAPVWTVTDEQVLASAQSILVAITKR